jgi:UDP-N-acetylglucosamine enolpyruvyl transferase
MPNAHEQTALMTFGSQGAIMDVTELLDKYSANIKADLDAKVRILGSQHRSGRRDLRVADPAPAAWLVTNAYAIAPLDPHRLPGEV